MHKTALLMALPLTLALAACNPGGSSPAAGDSAATGAAAVADNIVTGTVALREGVNGTVSADARLEVSLEDTTQRTGVPLATKTIQPVGSLPVTFELEFDPRAINANDVIVVIATLTDGARRYTMPLQAAVLTKGKPSHADIKLVPEPTESEKIMESFHQAERQIGAMQMTRGSALTENSGRAWQVFTRSKHVHFVRDIEDDFNTNARVDTDFAFEDEKPWVVVRKHRPAANAEPTRIERAAWDESGKLVMHEIESGGNVSDLPVETAEAMHRDALRMLQRVSD